MAINASASYPGGAVSPVSVLWVPAYNGNWNGSQPISDLQLLGSPDGGADISSGSPFFISGGTVLMGNGTLANGNSNTYGDISAKFKGHVTTFTLTDVTTPYGAYTVNMDGIIDVLDISDGDGGGSNNRTVTTNQTAPLVISLSAYANETVTINATSSSAVTVNGFYLESGATITFNAGSHLISSGSVTCTSGSATYSGSFSDTDTNAILAAWVAGSSTGGSLTIGGDAPSGAGITDAATLVSNGVTLTTN